MKEIPENIKEKLIKELGSNIQVLYFWKGPPREYCTIWYIVVLSMKNLVLCRIWEYSDELHFSQDKTIFND